MARSCRTPVVKSVGGRCSMKKRAKGWANKNVRHAGDIPSGGAFKKYFCTWDISDYNYFADGEWEKKFSRK